MESNEMAQEEQGYSMLLPEHGRYHKLGPKDVFKSDAGDKVMNVEVVRQTSSTGEQIMISVPVFANDDRETMMNRINMAYSILQERLEDENKVMMHLQEKQQKRRMFDESMKRNEIELQKKINGLKKDAKKQGWKDETLDKKIAEVRENFEKASKLLEENVLSH